MAARLCLGTVQMGTAYGIAGPSERVADGEARQILDLAWEAGIRRLDTAPGYGDIEERLLGLIGANAFEIVTKIPALPAGKDAATSTEYVRHSLDRSRARLGDAITGILFHSAADLEREDGQAAWEAAFEWCARHEVALGVSVYGAAELAAHVAARPIAMAQLPANALDQRIALLPPSDQRIELTARSAFLQGLLLMDQAAATQRLPAAAACLAAWHAFCGRGGLEPAVAALGVIKGLKSIDYCAVGVDNAEQLAQIVAAWESAAPIEAPELATTDPSIIDPRRWS